MNDNYIKNVVEAALLAAGRPLQLTELVQLFDESARPDPAAMRAALDALTADYESRGIEVKETATGFRIQVRREMANEVSRLWPERPPKYSRALLETLALIAYRQPITRAEIEAVRGVAVNPNIIKTVLERNWVKVVGTRDVPGRPELLGTTRDFLDYFGLKSLEDLPPLAELKAMGEINLQLDLAKPDEPGSGGSSSDGSGGVGGADSGASGIAAAAAVAAVASAAGEAANEASNGAESGVAGASDEVAAGGEAGDASAGADGAASEAVSASSETIGESVGGGSSEAARAPGDTDDAVANGEPAPAIATGDAVTADSTAETFSELPALDPLPEEPVSALEVDPHFTVEHDISADTLTHIEIESDPGDVTVEVEALSLIEARIEASIESDEPAAAGAEPAKPHDASIETGEFELSELGMTRAPGSVIEAEFDAGDLDSSASDEDAADDDEELSASPNAKSGLVAAPRDQDD